MTRQLPPFSYRLSGVATGPTITFIPGIANDATFWAAQADALAERFRVLTFSPWGHGDSPPPPAECRYADIVEGVVQMWDRLGIARSGIVGLGFGGSVALSLGLEVPSRVERIVACCCRPRQPDDRRDFWRKRVETALTSGLDALMDQTVDRWLRDDFRAAHPEVDRTLREMAKRTTVEGYRAYVNAFVEMDFEARLDQLRVPVMLVAAEHDHGGGPVESMRGMAERIPGSEFEIVTGAGHIVNHEAPATVLGLLHRAFAPISASPSM